LAMRGGSSFGPCLPFLVIGQASEFKRSTAAVTLQKVPRKKLRQAACSRAASKAAMGGIRSTGDEAVGWRLAPCFRSKPESPGTFLCVSILQTTVTDVKAPSSPLLLIVLRGRRRERSPGCRLMTGLSVRLFCEHQLKYLCEWSSLRRRRRDLGDGPEET
jgi:hypothetical protein